MPVQSANAARTSSRVKRVVLPLLGGIAAALGLIATLLLATLAGAELPGSMPSEPNSAVSSLSAPAGQVPGSTLG
ncbi:hypothetical protein ACFS2C_25120 [Prauserella oleivorans]|uniref:Uncharacterized protein n=1 Tax=Prauserella oleivorans TaxID=1478153 RepID=A0ABW5WJS9_9PSEU